MDALTNKLQDVKETNEESDKKKKDFDEKRRKHYANEFNMGKQLNQQDDN